MKILNQEWKLLAIIDLVYLIICDTMDCKSAFGIETEKGQNFKLILKVQYDN